MVYVKGSAENLWTGFQVQTEDSHAGSTLSAVQVYRDVGPDDDTYRPTDIGIFLTDDEVKIVVAKLKRV